MALPPLIPLRHLFDNPERAAVQISPDGTHLSYLAPEEGRLNVWVQTLGRDDARCVTHDHARGISFYGWSRDGRIIYLQDEGGNENYHLFAADAAALGEPARDLTPFEGVRIMPVDFPRATPREALVAMNRRNPQVFDVHRLSLDTGVLETAAENPGDVIGWLVDAGGKLRGAVGQTAEGGWDMRVRDAEDAPWRSATVYANEDEPTAAGFLPDGALWVGSSRGADCKRLVRLDPASGEETGIDSEDGVDLASALVRDSTKELLAAVYERDRMVVRPFQERFARDWDRVRAVHPGDPTIAGEDEAERVWIVAYNDPRDPGATYLFRRDSGEAEFLLRPRPWLVPEHLAPMEPVSFAARDSLTIRGFLTVPVGVEARGLPMVLLVHGGPWARDSWGYDPEVQFFANRGYAVLQLNYRASTGYGKSFLHAGDREWGRAMLDDLVDGVRWAVARGVADPERVAIYGGSYGGYAALAGLTFAPEVFACGVSLCGPSSLLTFIKSVPPYWAPLLHGILYPRVGNPDDPAQEEDLRARSPLYHIDRIRAPLMIGQGANDVRVTKAESDQIVEALRARGIDVEYIVKDDEGHGFANPENRLDFYAAVERFLARHLGGRAEA